MVFFTCNACGESLKKNAVEKHYRFKCRQCNVLTCVDCHKDFAGDDYLKHVKCISEAEKYSAKGWQPKAGANKGEKKQQAWIENIQALLQDPFKMKEMDGDVARVMEVIIQHENIPRKRQKFINFIKNIMRGTSAATIDKTWDVFETALKPKPVEQEEKSKPVAENGHDEGGDQEPQRLGIPMFAGTQDVYHDDKKKKKKGEENKENGGLGKRPESKKRKRDKMEIPDEKSKMAKVEDLSENVEEEACAFDWPKVIESFLKKKGGEIKLSRLQKKVIDEYCAFYEGTKKTRVQLEKKILKKLEKSKQFKVSKDMVRFAK